MSAPARPSPLRLALRARLHDDGRAAPHHAHQATSQPQINRREVGPLQAVAVGPLQAVAPNPHFDTDALARSLPERGVAYVHLPRLGGWRQASADSPNGAWRNVSFRGYADYAMGEAFADGLAQLRALAAQRRTAMMCSEALWWRCHRRLVADRLLVAGDRVCHISSGARVSVHRLPAFATVEPDGLITYS